MTEEEWLICDDPKQMLESLQGKASERKLQLLSCACSRIGWESLNHDVYRAAIERSEQFADGLSTKKEWAAVKWKCNSVWLKFVEACLGNENKHWEDSEYNAMFLARSCTKYPLIAPHIIKRTWPLLQIPFLHDIFGNPFRPITINPAWLSPTVTNLATAAYEERALPSAELDPTRLAILADALEEASCDNQELLGHLRCPGPHARGCHVLDLLLGKS